jgi:hypothetical protein
MSAVANPHDNPWTDVGVHLPEPLLDVLIVYKFEGEPTVDMAFRRASGEWFLTGSEPLIRVSPTHFMHLPEPPTQENLP